MRGSARGTPHTSRGLNAPTTRGSPYAHGTTDPAPSSNDGSTARPVTPKGAFSLVPPTYLRRLFLSPSAVVGGALALVGLVGPAGVGAQVGPPGLDLPVVEDTLSNGMRFLVLRRPGAPTASFVLRFDVGSVNEVPGETGIAHFLEHLLFQGTTTIGTTNLKRERFFFSRMDSVEASRTRAVSLGMDSAVVGRLRRWRQSLQDSARRYEKPNQFTDLLTRNGARDVNATTDYESTTYYMRLPANRAELWFVMEADRMANPVFRGFYTERAVVAEERRTRLETTPEARLMAEFYATAFHIHPYGVPVIGYLSDIRRYTRRQVRDYHTRFYGPSNAIATIVGDVDPDRMLALARRYFGPIPAGGKPAPVAVEEPAQRGERRVEVASDAEREIVIGWHVPSGYSPDMPALEMLARLLTGGTTSRLYRRLVLEEHLATSVSASIEPAFRDPQLIVISARPLRGVSLARVESAIYEELDRVRRVAPTTEEIQRVRNQLEAGDVRRLASNLGLAFQLAESESYFGDWRETFRSGEKIASVTPADVQRVLERYLTRDNRTVALLVKAREPTGSDAGGPS